MSATRIAILAAAMSCGLAWPLRAEDKPAIDPAKFAAEMQQKLLEKFDTNKDGKLSDEERLRAQQELRKMGGLVGSGLTPGGFPGGEEFLKKFDKNGDGKLSDAERLAAQAAMQKMRGGDGPATGGLNGLGGATGGYGLPADGAGDKPTRKVNPLIKQYDKDGDGKLNAEEKAALQADRAKKKGKDKAEPKGKAKE